MDYIRKHELDAKVTKDNERGQVALEWKVSPGDLSAFHAITSELENGGVLRLTTSPNLGYAVNEIAYVSPKGESVITFTASDFKEAKQGIWVPGKCDCKYDNGFFIKYDILKVDSVNETIPNDRFSVELPPGTVVADYRPTSAATFVIGDSSGPISGLDDVLRVSKASRPWFITPICYGVVFGLLLLSAWIVARRWTLRAA